MAGRPPIYTSSEELKKSIDAYFLDCAKRKRAFITKDGSVVMIPSPAPIHITGLCAYLEISNDTLRNYEKLGDVDGQFFGSTIARAKKKCEMYAVDQLFEGNKGNKADFVLKNNFKWKDKTEQDINFKGDMAMRIMAARNRGCLED
jgi:hypothetical protein